MRPPTYQRAAYTPTGAPSTGWASEVPATLREVWAAVQDGSSPSRGYLECNCETLKVSQLTVPTESVALCVLTELAEVESDARFISDDLSIVAGM
jgi:hypothetical protein